MFKKLSLIFILALAALVLLVSCQRAASQAPLASLATPTVAVVITGEQPTSIGQVEMIGTTQMIQTMTAMFDQTRAAETIQPTSTLVGALATPTTFSLIPPTGVATTPAPGITPVVNVPTSTPGHPSTYTLMQGEFPYCIARRFNVNQDELLSLNNLTVATANNLLPGVVLRIPQSGNSFVGERALHPHPGTYTVLSGEETIYKVACYYGDLDPTQIIAANGLISPYTLHANQTLIIP
jgi:LysM repeat protein